MNSSGNPKGALNKLFVIESIIKGILYVAL